MGRIFFDGSWCDFKEKNTPGERWEGTFINSSGGNIAAEVDLSSVCRKRGRRVDADVFFKMSSEFVKGSIRATSSMNTLKSELGGEKGSRLQFAALLLSLHVTSVWFFQREAVSERQRPFGFYVWTSFKSRVQISGGRMRRAASPLFLFKILICDRWETLCKMFAERPSHSLSIDLFIYLAVINTHRQTETAINVVVFCTDANLQHPPLEKIQKWDKEAVKCVAHM